VRPLDQVEDEDVGLEPLVMALALSESVVWLTSRGESGVGIKLRSAWGCGAADEAAGGTDMSVGGAARVRRSVECACTGELSNRSPEVLGLEFDADCVCTEVFSILAPELILGLELSPCSEVRGLDSEAGSSVCCMEGSVVLLDVEDTRGLVLVGKVIECGLLLKSV
jgi:hypothetical protein